MIGWISQIKRWGKGRGERLLQIGNNMNRELELKGSMAHTGTERFGIAECGISIVKRYGWRDKSGLDHAF